MSEALRIRLTADQQADLGADGDGEDFLFLAFPGAVMERVSGGGLAIVCSTSWSEWGSESESYSESESESDSDSASQSQSEYEL